MTDQVLFYSSIKDDVIEKLVNTMSSDVSADDTSDSFKDNVDDQERDEESDDASMMKKKKRFHQFSDSTSGSDNDILEKHENNEEDEKVFEMGCGDTATKKRGYKQKSRIRTVSSSDDELKKTVERTTEKLKDLSRIKKKRNKLRDKFRNLATKPNQRSNMEVTTTDQELDSKLNNLKSENSDEEQVSCNKIKQTFKDKHMMKISSICDPDSSDDEEVGVEKQTKKSSIKSTRFTSPKPIKISAKQAMENMQKIKSESNRMLREKEVSLPYHRPKALSLKDIMSRRKPALASDGKVLSIKMTTEQLEQYALQLEQRQKEMMELCKSDTDEDDDREKKDDHETEKTDKKTNDQRELEDKTPDNTKMDTQIELLNMVNDENNVNEIDTEPCVVSEHLKSTDCTLNAGDVDVYKDSNDVTNSPENIKEIDASEGNVEVLHGVEDNGIDNITNSDVSNKNYNKDDSQMMKLHYDSEKVDSIDLDNVNENEINENTYTDYRTNTEFVDSENIDRQFLENNLNFSEIDAIMENIEDKGDSGKHIPEISLNTKPKLTGAPGMVIDLDNNTLTENKLSGVEQLKERFKYFARLKSLEEQEKDREKKFKPGVQHLKLKQELEEQIAEQRSLEWTKRLEQEKQQQLELNAIRGDDTDIDDIEKVEAKLEQLNDSHVSNYESSGSESAGEEEICEDDCRIEDKPRKRNPLIDEEAEESDIEEDAPEESDQKNIDKEDDGIEDIDASDEDSSEDESDEDEETSKPKKGRILKAFEDSDDEDVNNKSNEKKEKRVDNNCETSKVKVYEEDLNISSTQDDELQLAQVPKTSSEEIIISQDLVTNINILEKDCDQDMGSQTFSITNTGSDTKCLDFLVAKETGSVDRDMFADENLYASQNIDSQQELNTPTQSQEIGDDILALCTGKFYDNPFVSQLEDNISNEAKTVSNTDVTKEKNAQIIDIEQPLEKEVRNQEKLVLSSILEELDDPQFESPKRYSYFVNNDCIGNKENLQSTANKSSKKKLVIDSDDEVNEGDGVEKESKKKNKKRKIEKRALQFSDDEEDIDEGVEETEAFESDIEEDPETDIEGDSERIIEYDSEENEVDVQPQKKKKRVGGDFFEQEAELTSEDEWVGSGDEDEADLDRMEREEGDDDIFHEGKLRKELGQIHMRDVLDQDKREVRLLQELLFEDGDLGEGHRQRKFRWKNADDAEETGAAAEEFADTQEEEFESEELWRKQRHEREMFLRKMKGEDEDLNTSINRSALIKASLSSRTMTSNTALNTSATENTDKETVQEKKAQKDIPSPKKPFAIFQQNYHGSLLSRGKGALARLAAIATPLAGDGEAPKVSTSTNRRNFVFAALSQDEVEPKVSKRKADTIAPSPVLIKKMKAEEKQKQLRSSLFDYLEA